MPDIRYSVSIAASKGLFSHAVSVSGRTADMATAGMLAVTLNLGTAAQQISTATLGASGLCLARSLATTPTHTVSFGRLVGTSLYETVRLKAGEAALFRMHPGDYGAVAAVANSRLLINILED